jgi:hypothetical protein
MHTRNCPSCNATLVYKNKSSVISSNKRNVECRKCAYSKRDKMSADERKIKRKMSSAKYKLKLQKFVWDYLSNNHCVDCGEANILFLEFDHTGKKTEWISWLIRKHASLDDIKFEISKCEVRCIGCHRKKTNQKYTDSKNKNSKQVKFIREFLQNNQCIDCKTSDADILEFDHVRGQKTYNVSTLVGSRYSVTRIKEEIDKCDIVCCKCHRIRTATRSKWKILEYMSKDNTYSKPP